MQKIALHTLLAFIFSTSLSAFAAEAAASNATGSLFKMLIGLAVVLLVLALISWLMKKFMPIGANQASVIRVIGGASVGSREKVVVLEVANRWLVVGVAAGQVTSLANLEPGDLNFQNTSNLQATQNTEPFNLNITAGQGFATQSFVTQSFAKWLKASSAKFADTKFADKSKAEKDKKDA